ncbi:MAG: hypothetical protein Q9176_000754 [Flavoplaca citrina]
MQSTGREMRVVEEAAPLQELEPRPMQQNTFSAILEHEKEAKEPKVKESAVRFINTLPSSQWKSASSITDLLIEAGADPRIRNKAKLKPMDLVDPKNKELRNSLQKAEYAMTVEDVEAVDANVVVGDDADEGPTGSASDSD